MSEFVDRLFAADARLVERGFPPVSPWWRDQIARFLGSGRRRWVIRAGRRSGKSTTLARLAVSWAIWGNWTVAKGDTPFCSIVSVNKDEASSRLRTIAQLLKALGVPFEQRGDEIETVRGVVFKVFAATTSATVGFTSIMVLGDEVSRWENRDHSANPAAQVIASLAPTMASVAGAFMVLSSSPWTDVDYHAQQFALGETEHQLTSFGETWTCNPTLTEADTHALEPDERVWSREYAAVPSTDLVVPNWWTTPAIELSFTDDPFPPINFEITYYIAADLAVSETSGDCLGSAVVSCVRPPVDVSTGERPRGRLLRVHEAHAWRPDRSPREMARRLKSEVCDKYGVARVYADQFHGRSWAELAKDVGLNVQIHNWSGGENEGSKSDLYKRLRTLMLEGCVKIPRIPADLISEFKATRSVLLPSGGERIEVPRSAGQGHGDRVSAIVLAASKALQIAPQLADPSPWEQIERERNRQKAIAIFGAAPGLMNERELQQYELSEMLADLKHATERAAMPKIWRGMPTPAAGPAEINQWMRDNALPQRNQPF